MRDWNETKNFDQMFCKLNAMELLSIYENFHHEIFNPGAMQTYIC